MNWLRIPKSGFQKESLLSSQQLEGTRIFATTILRNSRNHKFTGMLLEINWKQNQVERYHPIPLDSGHPFWNPRGGNRGGRGLVAFNGVLYVATALSILQFDKDLQQIGEITHPYLAGLHEMYIAPEGIWVTSTVHDLVVKLDFEGNLLDEWWGSESQVLQNYFGFTGRQFNLAFQFSEENFVAEYQQYCRDERLHVNSVWVYEGEVYILSCRKKAFIKIRPEPESIIVQDESLESPHNGIITQDGHILINDTEHQRIRMYERVSGKHVLTVSTPVHKKEEGSEQFLYSGWQRGLAPISNTVYLVGTSPATIFEVDIEKGVLGQICRIDTNVAHCIHGLTVARNF